MRMRTIVIAGLIGAAAVCSAFAWQLRPFREYPGREYENFPLPPDAQEKTEWVFARLMYPQFFGNLGFGYRNRFGSMWKEGRTSWTTDYPRADRHLATAVRRLSRIHVRSVEQP